MKHFRNILILVICISLLSVAFYLKFSSRKKDIDAPMIEIIQGTDNTKSINVYVGRALIRKEISPIVIEEFLSGIKISCIEEEGGLELVDFGDNSLLAKYGFKKGDIIKTIDGKKVGSILEAIRICDTLEGEIFGNRDERDINVSLTRDGEDINMNFKIPEFVPENVHYTMRLEKRIGE